MSANVVFNNTSMHFKSSFTDQLKGLLVQARSGNEAAFTQLYDLFFEKIYRFTFFRVGHKEVAEDLTEDVFIKAFSNLHSLQQDQVFESWLYQIARNRIIDYYRSKKQIVALDEVENTLEYETNVIDILNLESQQKIFIKILKELSAEQQMVIKLKFLEGLENDEIASLMEKNEGAIRVIQHRAIAKLKELISQVTDNNESTN
jgi:RNA polymerase sigma-70 factor (ECF subfamily)